MHKSRLLCIPSAPNLANSLRLRYHVPPNSKVWGSGKRERARLNGWHADLSWGPRTGWVAGGSQLCGTCDS